MSVLRLYQRRIFRCTRLTSSWINGSSSNEYNRRLEIEPIFTNNEVQSLLYGITGLDLEGKVFRARSIGQQQRPQYHLMTNKMLQESVNQFEMRGRKFLQFVPFKEPRRREFQVLAKEEELAGFDQSKFVFTDITFDATNRDRLVVVRETDGTLRTAQPSEHDRMNRVYYQQPERPVVPPAVFFDPHLTMALQKDRHEFVMDWACYFYEPDDPDFVNVSKKVFDHVLDNNKLNLLHSTRHFGCFAFYSILNGRIVRLLEFFASRSDLDSASQVVCLQKLVFPDWKSVISSDDSPRRILQDFVKKNKGLIPKMPLLVALLEGKTK